MYFPENFWLQMVEVQPKLAKLQEEETCGEEWAGNGGKMYDKPTLLLLLDIAL